MELNVKNLLFRAAYKIISIQQRCQQFVEWDMQSHTNGRRTCYRMNRSDKSVYWYVFLSLSR